MPIPKTKNYLPDVKAKAGLSKKMAFSANEIFNKIITVGLYLLFFLMPLLILPFNFEVLEFSKQNLLVFLVLIVFVSWLGKIIVNKKLTLKKNPLNSAVIIFFIIYLVSTIFSADRYVSFWGTNGTISNSFVSVLSMGLLFWVVINTISFSEIKKLLSVFFIGSAIAVVFFILQAWGVFLLPFGFSKSSIFNTIGSVNSAAIFFAFISVLCVGLTLKTATEKFSLKSLNLFYILLGVLCLYCVGITTFSIVWLGLGLAFLVMIVFITVNISSLKDKLTMIPMALLILGVIFYLIGFPLGPKKFPAEITLNYSSSWMIVKQSVSESPLIGNGPGNFELSFLKYKPKELNQTSFWNSNFNKPVSEYFNVVSTLGLFGFLSLLFIIGFFIFYSLKFLTSQKANSRWLVLLSFFSGFILLSFVLLFYYTNITTLFIWWLCLIISSLIFTENNSTYEFTFSKSPRISVIFSFTSIFIIIIFTGMFFVTIQRYIADVYYSKGALVGANNETITQNQTINDLDSVLIYIDKSLQYNKYYDEYYRNFAKAMLLRINQEFALPASDQVNRNIQYFTDTAINSAKRATEINPEKSENWVVLGVVYQNVNSYTTGASEWAVKSYEQAIKYDTANPALYTDLAKLYILRSDEVNSVIQMEAQKENREAVAELSVTRDEFLESALNNLLTAIELKPDYATAHFQIALVYVRQEKTDEAVKKLESILNSNPYDLGVMLQLAIIHIQQEETDKAKELLKTAISLQSNYANARWYLASIYEQEGEIEEAIKHLEIILTYNPDDVVVLEKLEQLKSGETGDATLPEPIEEQEEEFIPSEEE